MRIENPPPLNQKMINRLTLEAASLSAPGGMLAFYQDETLVTAFVSIAEGMARVVSWSSFGPLTREEAEKEAREAMLQPMPRGGVSIN